MAEKKKKPHYVNNKEFLQAMVEWKARCREAEEKGKPQPPITNYIGAVSYTPLTLPTKA